MVVELGTKGKTIVIRFNDSVIALMAAVLAAGSAFAQSVSIGTLPHGSIAFGIASSVDRVISDNWYLVTRVVGLGG